MLTFDNLTLSMSSTESVVKISCVADMFGYTRESTNTTSAASTDDGSVTGLPASLSSFIPCNNPDNLVSPYTAHMVEVAMHAGIYPVITVTGIITNVISMVVFARQGLTDRITLCLFSLSLADAGFLLFLMAGKSYMIVKTVDDLAGTYWQQLQRTTLLNLYLGFLNVSNAMTTVIAVERCICVVAPFKAKTFLKTKYMALLIFFIYMYILGVCATIALKYVVVRVVSPASNESFASVSYVTQFSSFYLRNKHVLDALNFGLIASVVPNVSLVVVIISTSITVYRLRVSLSWHRHSNAGEVTSAEQREAAVTTMLVTVCVVYVICMTPSVTFSFARKLVPDLTPHGRYCNSFKVAAALVHALEAVNSSANFYIYFSRGSRFRAMLSNLCHYV